MIPRMTPRMIPQLLHRMTLDEIEDGMYKNITTQTIQPIDVTNLISSLLKYTNNPVFISIF